MTDKNIYNDISQRTGGDIYIGVVGPVRTGKSTFIKRFMDMLVLPNIEEPYLRERACDELPQSSSGRTIMTTEPKFIPETAVNVTLENNAKLNVRLIDCVGYIVPSSIGYIENDQPRMVHTPWYDEQIPFNMAAEIGTRKVINEHSTIGLVVTTDGSIGEIPRDEYEEAEERVISELKEINKPFVVLLNCMNPENSESVNLAERLSKKHGVPVMPVNCIELGEDDIKEIIYNILCQFPIKEIGIKFGRWVNNLPVEHWLRSSLMETVKSACCELKLIGDVKNIEARFLENEHINSSVLEEINLGDGCVKIKIETHNKLFYKTLTEMTGLEITDEQELMGSMVELAKARKEYEKVKSALNDVMENGYGIVMPSLDELTLEEPEIMKQGGRYGVRLRASAPSIHMMKANITTEVTPIVGSEKQSEDLILYLLKEFEESPEKIWDSNIFGKSLHELVNEGLHTKLARMPSDARMRIKETLERVINEGCSGLICIIL